MTTPNEDKQRAQFEKFVKREEGKKRNWVASLDNAAAARWFKEKYHAIDHVDGMYCPACGARALYSTYIYERPSLLVCKECKSYLDIEKFDEKLILGEDDKEV